MTRLELAIERLRRIKKGDSLENVYHTDLWGHEAACFECDEDNRILAEAYLVEHELKPLEAYLAFANVLCVEEADLDAVALAKAMHKRGMVIPNE